MSNQISTTNCQYYKHLIVSYNMLYKNIQMHSDLCENQREMLFSNNRR